MTELKPFQQEGLHGIYGFRGRALLADEMGLGKTIQALAWLLKIRKHRPVIIVTPSSVKYTWQAEAAMHFGLRCQVIEGRRPEGVNEIEDPIVVINYDILKSWLPALLRSKPRCIIFDEVHYLKDPKTLRTRAAMKLVRHASSVLGLSGTPLTNRPVELWSILQLIRPDIFPDFTKFAWRYCSPKYTRWGWQFTGAANLKELRSILISNVMIRRLKREVEDQLPAKQRKAVWFRLPPAAMKQYKEAENDFLGWLRKTNPTKVGKAKRSEALVKVGYLLRLSARLKMNQTIEWLSEFFESNPDKKIVSMTMNTFVIDTLRERFPNSVIVNGSVTGRKREEARRKFISNRKINLFLGNWRAAGVGLNLQVAHHFVALDFPWTPGDLLQGEDRIHRIGQKNHCLMFYLTALDTIEEKLVEMLKKKTEILNAILNGKRSTEDFDLFDTLLKDLGK